MKAGLTYHCAISVDIDRFPDRELLKWLQPFLALGCVTPADIRRQCTEARARGQVVFAPCDHHAKDGTCLGHPIEDGGES